MIKLQGSCTRNHKCAQKEPDLYSSVSANYVHKNY